MSTIDEILDTISDEEAAAMVDDVLVIDPTTRQISVPESEMVFGVISDTHSERKYFRCARVVGNNIDLTSCFLRVNYRNANGVVDAYLVDDVTVAGDNIVFSWELSRKVTQYKGQVKFVVCACRPGGNGSPAVEWNTTVATGLVLEGLEPDTDTIEGDTSDVVAQLIAMVERQTEIVEAEGSKQVGIVEAAAEAAGETVVAEIEAKGVNTLATIPDDYTALSGVVDGLVRSTAPGIVCEIEGESVFVSDASDTPVQSLRVFGRSTQDGVPSPDAPVEIVNVESPTVTVCGKNLLEITVTSRDINGGTLTVNPDKTITLNGTVTKNTAVAVGKTNCCGECIFSAGVNRSDINDSYLYIALPDGDLGWYGTDKVFTNRGTRRSVYMVIVSGTYNNITLKPMIRPAISANTTYEPYRGQTLPTTHSLPGIPVTSGGNYTDSNGQQWVCDEVDFERGVYVQRVCSQTYDGVEGESFALYAERESVYGFTIKITDEDMLTTAHKAFCSHFENIVTGISGADRECFLCGAGSKTIYVLIAKDRISGYSVDDFKTWLAANPITIVFQLATPIETPLTEIELAAYRALHTNKPNTTILNDKGAHMAVAYTADTKLYIDNKIATLA